MCEADMKRCIEKANAQYRACRIPGLVRTRYGTLLGYYECRNTVSDWAQIDLKVIRSTDSGETWQTVCMFPGDGNTLNNPVMIVDGETIHFLFCRNYRQLYACRSTDDGLTFTVPAEKTQAFEAAEGYNAAAVGPGHGIEHNGILLIPAWFAYNKEEPRAHRPSVIRMLYSQDHGESWKLSSCIGEEMLRNPSECALAVLPDQRVLLSIRHENLLRRRAFSVSQNGVDDWKSPCFVDEVPDPICQGSMAHTDRAVFHINCASEKERQKLTLRIWQENGNREILIDETGGYADLATDGQTVWILYERDVSNDGLYFTQIRL